MVYTDATKAVVDKKLEENANGANHIMWRISSTFFSHLRYDVDLTPLAEMEHMHDRARV